MNTILESTELYIDTFTEIVKKLSASLMTLTLNTFGFSSELINIVKTKEISYMSALDYLKLFINYLAFDNFQLLLLKLFICTFVCIIIMIYGAWWIYGSRISDRFMDRVINMDNKRGSLINN
ncbi:GSCOCG00005688001-RA-CDS [Cotesia congregata]|nr:GSCOCG00005688001-RA-CDS [Cotesia congregata]